jgi:hypothetical protein
MATQKVTPKQILMRTPGQTFMNRDHQASLEGIMEVAGINVNWFVDTSNWDMVYWPNRGANGNPKQIVIKTDANTINAIIDHMNSHGSRKKIIESSKAHTQITIRYSFPRPAKPQLVKFQQTGKVTNASGNKVSDAAMTAMQELGSLWVFKRSIQDNKTFNKWQDIKTDPKTYDELIKIWTLIGKVPTGPGDEWLEVFYKQNKAFFGKISKANVSAMDEFTRGKNHANSSVYTIPGSKNSDTFMDYISKHVANNFGISQKDNWNPADIWLIKNEKHWRDRLDNETSVNGSKGSASVNVNLQQCNDILRQAYAAHDIIGISLKKIGSGQNAIYEAVNTTKEFVNARSNINYKKTYQYNGANCYLDKKADGSISQDTILYIGAGESSYKFQVKANSSSDRNGSGLKYEGTQEGRGAARLGKATVKLVLDLMDDYNLSFSSSKTDYPFSIEELMSKETEYLKRLKILKKNKVNLARTDATFTADAAYDNLLYLMGTEAHVANSKCQQIMWLSEVLKLNDDNKRLFLADLVFLSKKEGERYGPFGKIY